MEHLKNITEAVISAEEMAASGHVPDQLHAVLRDLGWSDETFSRELMFLLRNCEYKLEGDLPLRQLMFRFCNGSNSTQSILESGFAHLRDISQRQAKALKMSPFSTWFYSVASPYVQKSGMAQLLPSATDWSRYAQIMGRSSDPIVKAFHKLFHLDKTEVPKGEDIKVPISSRGIVKTGWRNAGPLSHYKSSAATAFLAEDFKNGFSNAAAAWTAVVLCQGNVFYNWKEDSFWLSLGFMVWCSLGVRLAHHNLGTKDLDKIC